jgi:hypothetical protein
MGFIAFFGKITYIYRGAVEVMNGRGNFITISWDVGALEAL